MTIELKTTGLSFSWTSPRVLHWRHQREDLAYLGGEREVDLVVTDGPTWLSVEYLQNPRARRLLFR